MVGAFNMEAFARYFDQYRERALHNETALIRRECAPDYWHTHVISLIENDSEVSAAQVAMWLLANALYVHSDDVIAWSGLEPAASVFTLAELFNLRSDSLLVSEAIDVEFKHSNSNPTIAVIDLAEFAGDKAKLIRQVIAQVNEHSHKLRFRYVIFLDSKKNHSLRTVEHSNVSLEITDELITTTKNRWSTGLNGAYHEIYRTIQEKVYAPS